MRSYPFESVNLRAQCIRVVDGDTADMFVDRGNHDYSTWRVRLYGINTPELHAKSTAERTRALDAMAFLATSLSPGPGQRPRMVNLDRWPIRMRSHKDPDSFGRWLVELWWGEDTGEEHAVNGELLALGLAVPFKP